MTATQKNEKYRNKVRKAYSILVCLTPVFCMYKSPVPNFSLGEVLLLGFTFVAVIFKGRRFKLHIYKEAVLFVVVLIWSLLMSVYT